MALLDRYGIPYTFYDVEHDQEAAQRCAALNGGQLLTPTVLIDGVLYKQPSETTLAKALGLLPDDPSTLVVEQAARGGCDVTLQIAGMG